GGGAAPGGERLAGSLDDLRGAGVGLEAAAGAAAAQAAAIGAVDPQVPELAAVAVFALDDHVADDNAAADAGAEREQHHALRFLPRTDPEFAISRGVRIVLIDRRFAERLANVLANRHILPRLQIRRIENEAGLDVHEAGGGDA